LEDLVKTFFFAILQYQYIAAISVATIIRIIATLKRLTRPMYLLRRRYIQLKFMALKHDILAFP
jgi:hypothetical protein